MELFKSDFGEVRELTKGGEPWFIAKDICDILGYTNSRKAVSDHVDKEDRSSVTISYGSQGRKLTAVNESGMYSLVLRSNLPEAKRFKRWVTSEVLPCIRKTGKYKIPTEKIKEAKETRTGLTKQWEEHGIKGHNFMNLTKHIKKTSGLTKPRNQLTKEERMKMAAIEAVESYKLLTSKDSGYYPLKQSATNTIGLIEQA